MVSFWGMSQTPDCFIAIKWLTIWKPDQISNGLNFSLSWTILYSKKAYIFFVHKQSSLVNNFDHLKSGPDFKWLKQDVRQKMPFEYWNQVWLINVSKVQFLDVYCTRLQWTTDYQTSWHSNFIYLDHHLKISLVFKC